VNKVRNILLMAALLLLLASVPAHADCNPGLMWGLADTGFVDRYIPYLFFGPDYGFSVYGCPSPILWASGNLSRYYAWFSTCLSGGQAVQLVSYSGDATYPSQVNVNSQLHNPFNNELQGVDSGFAYAQYVNFGPAVPQWTPLEKHGGPCGPNI
jgi:hypothetical protein